MIFNVKRKIAIVLIIFDLFAINLSLFLASITRLNLQFSIYYFKSNYIYIILITFLTLISFYLFYLYTFEIKTTMNKYIINFTFAFLALSFIIAAVFYLLPKFYLGRGIWAIFLVFSYFLTGLFRLFILYYLKQKHPRKRFLIIGVNEESKIAHDIISRNIFSSYIGSLSYKKMKAKKDSITEIIGLIDDIEVLVDQYHVDAIVITDRNKINASFERKILNCKMKGCEIFDIIDLHEMFNAKIPISMLDDYWIIFNSFRGIHNNFYNLQLKRLIDILISSTGLIISFPIAIISALLIKLTSRGSIFYSQVRLGRGEKHFKIYKFRSMKQNSETNGAVWASKNDSRVTLFGRFIRLVRIDEIPQMWNVLKGEMSFIGPRPERPEFVDLLKKEIPYYSLRHLVKPGITGWAQVNYPYGASIKDAEEKLKYDLYYMRHLSLRLDLITILKTMRIIISGKGAR